ncbi:MAG: hypothetical protein GC136_09560 [Alphaproteobacteria bacterium]|nr:hypothetical protein [Alphaproteobacteria bacterium]
MEPRRELLEALKTFMKKHGGWSDDYPGLPFVISENEFGLTCSYAKGSLYAINFLTEALEHAEVLTGQREDRTDLDTLMFELRPGITKLYDGVEIEASDKFIILTIKTDYPVKDLIGALEIETDRAQRSLDRAAEEKKAYALTIAKQFEREATKPVFGYEDDMVFVKEYLATKLIRAFAERGGVSVSGPQPGDIHLAGIFAEYGIIDQRPVFKALFNYNNNDHTDFNNFKINVLQKIFTGPQAVQADGKGNRGLSSFEIRGNPSRLALDIIENDYQTALQVAQGLGLTPTKRFESHFRMA